MGLISVNHNRTGTPEYCNSHWTDGGRNGDKITHRIRSQMTCEHRSRETPLCRPKGQLHFHLVCLGQKLIV